MNTIYNLAWRSAQVFEVSDLSVGLALGLAKDVFPKGAVLYYKDVGRSVLVFEDYLGQLVNAAELNSNGNIIETGILDVLGQGQMMVHRSVPAITVSRIVNFANITLALVVDDEHAPLGLFLPYSVLSILPNVSKVQVPQNLPLESMVEMLDNQMPDFHAELINTYDHDVLWCDAGHVTHRCPCPVLAHKGKGCSPRRIAS